MTKLFYKILAVLGFWVPCDKFMPDNNFDWVMISAVDCKGCGIRLLPMVAEWNCAHLWWDLYTEVTDDYHYFINNDCVVTHWRRIPNFKRLKIK